ncbi:MULTISPECIES: hypothetical protein [Flammeovirga]|uniref:Secreted protein n=1 Tax=Flammeovirga agarivorans TaxID=2726742 RepID=A0A7X8SGV4_9BACT|nr:MULTISPECIES: hypothetical protein [Flammeovirga]NLR90011.1 hypothetical protein [Flammeovirga agarivorans]
MKSSTFNRIIVAVALMITSTFTLTSCSDGGDVITSEPVDPIYGNTPAVDDDFGNTPEIDGDYGNTPTPVAEPVSE